MPRRLQRMMAGLAGLILVVVVALQNRHPVQIHILFWALPHVPLVVVVLVSMLVGLLAGALGMWWDRHRRDHLAAIPPSPSAQSGQAGEPAHPPLVAEALEGAVASASTAPLPGDLGSAETRMTSGLDQPTDKPL
ncbi:hypothetical protein Sulac_0553 [Sulfobacillus acidophilus DSM 10332]|uniref:Lipopolysaccharide assembly protein A domain-containing protein n=1 Tax=Sulfobacillus acidophilus (strain ATCC 700253 / DSM 10332 / NAL) TaxID=679936 RepID=G8TZC1_SULAD|nr:hypothetical protein Sulac_0553 [Sulfobacillus acidophilus DSM 10332]